MGVSDTPNCANCAGELPSGATACPHCGAAVQRVAPEPGPSVWETILERLTRATAPKYEVRRLLGYGGMAGVYLADEPRLGRQVAIKVMAPGLMLDPKLVDRFEQEARTIAQLHHPNVITIYDVTETADLHFFVMSYVPGRTLSQVLSGTTGQMPIPVIRAWLSQIGGALNYAHEQGVVHHDIKPGNILLSREGNAIVTDFGIAKVLDEPSLTHTGMIVGTPAYMSPEQSVSGEVTGASDQYSLGAVAYQMITGRPPFGGVTMAILQAHLHEPVTPLRKLRRDCPKDLARGIERMLAKTPEDRYPSIADALRDIDARPLHHGDPVRVQLTDLAAWPQTLLVSSDLAIEGPAVVGTISVGESFTLEAEVRGRDGRPLEGRAVQWSSEDPATAEVSAEGVVQALRPGEVRITATCEGVTESITFTIGGGSDQVVVLPELDPVASGESREIAALVHALGAPGTEADARFVSSNPEIARVGPDGVVTGLSPGSTTITVSLGGRAATTTLTVTPVPGTSMDDSRPARPRLDASMVIPSSRAAELWSAIRPELEDAPAAPPPEGWAGAGHPSGPATPVASGPGATATGDEALSPLTPVPRGAKRPNWQRVLMAGVSGGVLLAAFGLYVTLGSDAESGPVGGPGPDGGVGAGGTTDGAGNDAADGGGALDGRDPAGGVDLLGLLRVSGDLPPGGRILVRGPGGGVEELSGDSVALSPGQYELEVVAAGFQPLAASVLVRAGESVEWPFELRSAEAPPPEVGVVRIAASLPPGRQVTVRGQAIGERLMTGDSMALPPGDYELEATADGFEVFQERVQLRAGQQFAWAPSPGSDPPHDRDRSAGGHASHGQSRDSSKRRDRGARPHRRLHITSLWAIRDRGRRRRL